MVQRSDGKRLKFTNKEVVGFELPSESYTWDTPRRGKTKLMYGKEKVITCASWILKERWRKANNKRNGYVPKYKPYQYFDFICFFMTLMVIKVLKEELIFNFPYRLGQFKTIKSKVAFYRFGKLIHLNLHSFRMRYKILWSFGSIKSAKLYSLEKIGALKYCLKNALTKEFSPYDTFLFLIKAEKRRGAWVGAPDRDFDKLQQIIQKHYGETIYRPDIRRLDRRQRIASAKHFKESIKKVGD